MTLKPLTGKKQTVIWSRGMTHAYLPAPWPEHSRKWAEMSSAQWGVIWKLLMITETLLNEIISDTEPTCSLNTISQRQNIILKYTPRWHNKYMFDPQSKTIKAQSSSWNIRLPCLVEAMKVNRDYTNIPFAIKGARCYCRSINPSRL